MIEKILRILETTEYDFRKHTPNNDPLEYLFPEWVKYYQLKYAISQAIQPKSILETGVRFGYSAITFLEASPDASYVGIDIDSESYGGVKGAINWAKKIMQEYKTEFIIEDTTKMKSFPGEFYDLIHVDAQQDGDGTFGDLEKALEKGRYILVDGYFWSKPNMLSSTYFLDKYKEFIEYALIIPGYAGELLIKTKPNAKDMFSKYTGEYETLVDSYDSNYYLNDCGGYETFLQTNGEEITDHRLLATIYLAQPNKTKKILDIGSGRGELAYALSKSALHVVGLDYSKDAIDIAIKTFKNVKNLDFVQADILKYQTDERFDVILATDVVEHIEQDMLLKMFSKVKHLLREDGLFIIHTAPNKLKYMYEYGSKYKTATAIGTYIPKNPRTHYEDMMHINEQTPASLNRGLKQSFDNVSVWTAMAPDIVGDFDSKPNKQTLKRNDSIFAICSKKPINKNDIISILTQQPLIRDSLDIEIKALDEVKELKCNEKFVITVEIKNNSKERLSSLAPFPVHIAYHWKDAESDEYIIFDGMRSVLNPPIPSKSISVYNMNIIAPKKQGSYILEVSMVQEGQFWFEDIDLNMMTSCLIEII